MRKFNKPISSFKNRTVLVVGASSGIGMEIAKELRFLGKNLIVSARRAFLLEEEFSNNTSVKMDVANERSVEEFFETIENRQLKIDIVFWCAAIYTPMSYIKFSYAEVKKITEINLLSVYQPFLKITQHWLNNRTEFPHNPHWIWVSSVAGYFGLPGSCAYGPSKSALNNIAESSYVEFKPFNIDISLVCPGFVDTRLTKKNRFQMPFIITPKTASEEIFSGLRKGLFENHFPKRFTVVLKIIQLLPYRLFFFFTAKLLQKKD